MSLPLLTRFLGHRAQHLGFLRVLCRDSALAEELFQDLAVVVLEQAGQFDPQRGDFEGWVRGICRNLWRQHLRRRRPLRAIDREVEAAVSAALDERGPEEVLVQQEQLSRLQHCLERLPPAARALVRGRYEDALSSTELARAQDRSPGAIDTALCRIRSQLLACMGTS